jgi:hypothetical protein
MSSALRLVNQLTVSGWTRLASGATSPESISQALLNAAKSLGKIAPGRGGAQVEGVVGQVRLSTDIIRGTDQRLPPFFRKVQTSKGLRFILTSRDYILRQAQAQSSRLGAINISASEFVLNVGHYTRQWRAQMLYNHIYFSQLSASERDALLQDDFFLRIIDHPNFNPRVIELLTTPEYISMAGLPIRAVVQSALQNPRELWETPYRAHISDEGRAVMLALFFNEERPYLHALERAFTRMAKTMGLGFPRVDMPMKFRAAIRELERSVLAIQDRRVRFANPGIRDFLHRVVIEDRLLSMAIDAVTEFPEVDQAWTLFSSEKPRPTRDHPLAPAWGAVGKRLLEDGSGNPLDRLELAVDMYDHLQTETLLDFVRCATTELRNLGIESDEAPRAAHAFEMLVATLLPFDAQQEAKEALTSAVAKLLSERGSELALDDFKQVAARLLEHGTDPDTAMDAVRERLEGFVDQLREPLRDIRSIDELATFAHAAQRAVVPAAMQGSAVGAPRFFERRFSLMIRALGSPKMPRTVPSGQKPGNAYASHSRRFRLPAAPIAKSVRFRAPLHPLETLY